MIFSPKLHSLVKSKSSEHNLIRKRNGPRKAKYSVMMQNVATYQAIVPSGPLGSWLMHIGIDIELILMTPR